MIFVDQSDRILRRSTCRSCEHYVPDTDSCGTLILAGLLKNEKGIHVQTGEQKPLCGCVIKQKSKWALASCPLGKWSRTKLTDEQLTELQEIIATLEGKNSSGHLNGKDIKAINTAMKIVTGFGDYCGTCAEEAIMRLKELRRDLHHENNIGQNNGSQTEPGQPQDDQG